MHFNELAFFRVMKTMWGQNTIKTKFGDSESLDAFGRLRISQPVLLSDFKNTYDSGSEHWSDKAITGSTIVWQQTRDAVMLSASNLSGSRAIRQSKNRGLYQPGCSLKSDFTFRLNPSQSVTPNNICKRIGYYDTNNGIFFEQTGSTTNFVIRSTIDEVFSENRIPQSQWNIDKMNGTGESGINLDLTKVQILEMDLQWFGVGRIRLGFNTNGKSITAHQFLHSNVNSSVYMLDPNLPSRFEVINNNTSQYGDLLEQYCAVTFIEAGRLDKSNRFNISTANTTISSSQNNISALLSLRLNNQKPGILVKTQTLSILCTTSESFRWILVKNPILVGGDNAVWETTTGSNIQFDKTRRNTLNGGTIIESGYASAVGGGDILSERGVAVHAPIGVDQDGVADELVLCVQQITAGTGQYLASISFY